MKQSKTDSCVFRTLVDEEVILVLCDHVDDLVVARKERETFDAFYSQLQMIEFPVNDTGDLSWYVGCTFERDKAKDVVKIAQTAFVDSLRWLSILICSVSLDLRPNKGDEKQGDWPYQQAVGG